MTTRHALKLMRGHGRFLGHCTCGWKPDYDPDRRTSELEKLFEDHIKEINAEAKKND